ncbi:hypothetical protein FQU23_012955 [Flavobacterium sp. XN-5]|uniref:CsgG/HfaB family protein n=1 Tax=Flavobacterium sp. XN-5 TaxID=2599390 RepID=UPI0011C9643D|nr:CsgG/HfaB family protein [Flavobacterium sp. XN-5]NGY38417.1 hypothetical protein [Flavobacterium sp. XN-5]
MNKKKILLALLFSGWVLQAQDRIGIAFIPISYDQNTILSTDAKLVQESVVSSFVAAKKFAVVDREKLVELENEKKLQKTASFIDSKASITEGISKGASYLIATSILDLRHSEVKKGWESMLQLQIKVLDVSTGEILATENISSAFITPENIVVDSRKNYATKEEIKAIEQQEEGLQELQKHKGEAFTKSLQRLIENVRRFSNANFPINVEILNWDSKNKNRFVLSSGSKIGIYPGQLLDVMQVTEATVGGKTLQRNQKIAIACVVKVEDDNFSEAVIISTEKNYKKVRESDNQLKIVTR